MELTEKQIKKIRENRLNSRDIQYKLIEGKPSKRLLDKLEILYEKEGLFYNVFLYYEELKKKFGLPG